MIKGTGHMIVSIANDRSMSIESIRKTIKESVLIAYKKYFGSNENAFVKFDDNTGDLVVYAKKKIVEEVKDSLLEILEKDISKENIVEGDYAYIEINPKVFDRLSIQVAKQRTKNDLQGIEDNEILSEFKSKLNKVVIGYVQQNRNGDLYVNLGNTDGIIPKKYQSPREVYSLNDKIRVLVYNVKKGKNGIEVILSRTHPKFIEELLALEIPEIEEGIIKIHKIVRDPGYRIKVAVYSEKEEIDPVGPCIGQKGVRIQSIIKELEGEKIDIIPYSKDIKEFIKDSLTPAKIDHVYILDEDLHKALVVVSDDQLSLAIGKMGQNVRLANRLLDWAIDVKTSSQFAEMKANSEFKQETLEMFDKVMQDVVEEEQFEDISKISDLKLLDSSVISNLSKEGLDDINNFLQADEEVLFNLGVSYEKQEEINKILKEGMIIIANENDESMEKVEEDEELLCPECGVVINENMTSCPGCKIGLSFEFEEE
ncbi:MULTISPECIES: transcription termination factor NusA [Borreliella]|uniref:transcription termination factor NusA n=1 Tax=Borreliella TaxID=64895 RepID=UPI00018E26B7|nr:MULTISPECIES: transcription termination factor NusA [Borreliella]AFT84109.1 transcription elongation factor NusA [Borreliella garinii NMJW1]AHZ73766.1 transcription elongation factor NusA [Borreliella garinii SZ]APQ14805.1 transcription termination/antitermination protein NusA [Borreliella garinii]AZA28186.1 transcription termination/antitermination protein NusA [Borreliella garinii]EED29820.1 transcription elongation protein NusA [Borreliella garinii Far04]